MIAPVCRVLRLPTDQQRDRRRAQRIGEPAAGARQRQVAAQHAQRRHARRARTAAAARSRTAAACRSPTAANAGHALGGGRSALTIAAQQQRPAAAGHRARARSRRCWRRRPARGTAATNSDSDLPLRRAEAAHHRGGVEMAAQIARRGERDGDRGEHAPRPAPRGPRNFSARSSVCRTSGRRSRIDLHPLSAVEHAPAPSRGRHRSRRPRRAAGTSRDCPAAADCVAGTSSRFISSLGPEREQTARHLGVLLHDRADGQRRFADGEPRALLHAEPRREPRVDPDFAAAAGCPARRCPPALAGSTSMIAPRSG